MFCPKLVLALPGFARRQRAMTRVLWLCFAFFKDTADSHCKIKINPGAKEIILKVAEDRQPNYLIAPVAFLHRALLCPSSLLKSHHLRLGFTMLKVFSKLNDSVIYSSITIHPQKPGTQTPLKQTADAVKDQLLQETSRGCRRSAPRSPIAAHVWRERDRNRKSCHREAGDQQLMLCAICHSHHVALFQPQGFQSFSGATSHPHVRTRSAAPAEG